MDQEGFRDFLEARKLSTEEIEASIALAQRFEGFAAAGYARPAKEDAWAFSARLIEEGLNTPANYYALVRYGRFTHNDDVYVAFVELLDGAEAMEGLYRRTAEVLGEQQRDQVFAGLGLPPLGLPNDEKVRFTQAALARLETLADPQSCRAILADCLRDLPRKYFMRERRKYQAAKDIDTYLARRRRAFLRELETCRREGRLFYVQEITDQVLEFVRGDPEIEGGVREGQSLYVAKIPYMADRYLAETDETMKRYYACHCPWVREGIRRGDSLSPTFCYCSAGFYKKPWEVILGRPLQAEVLESVLQGGFRCRFVIHLPAEL